MIVGIQEINYNWKGSVEGTYHELYLIECENYSTGDGAITGGENLGERIKWYLPLANEFSLCI